MDRQNLSGQKYLFPAWDRAKTISIHTQKQNPPCSTLTHDRKVADSVPPVQRTTRDRSSNRSQDDPPPPLSQVTFTQQFKRVHHTLNTPPPHPSNNLSYALMLLRFCYDLFFSFCFSLFWKKKCAPFSSPSYATEFVYLPVVKYIQAHIPTRRV